MLDFQPVTWRDSMRLRKYYQNCDYGLCEYSVGAKIMWSGKLKSEFTESHGCLIVRSSYNGEYVFDYPVAGPDGDLEAALDDIDTDCMRLGIPPVFTVVPEYKAAALLRRYPLVEVSNNRSWCDYVYRHEDLAMFAGRRYSGQRNHIKRFYKQWPDALLKPLTDRDADAISAFWEAFEAEFPKKDDPGALEELAIAKNMLRFAGSSHFRTGGMFIGDKIVALCMSEKCGNMLINHIEKALYSYTGVYPAMVQAFAQRFGADCQWLNREDDAGDRGLRVSKLQYGPTRLAPKRMFRIRNELYWNLRQTPILYTDRLTLDLLREEDIPAYNALVLDAERNRYWGYDDVAGLGGPVEERSFYEVAERDFKNRLAINFAIRLRGKLIGEAVLYNFDWHGGAELGCRIDSAYAGLGYGVEAFAAVADWGIYELQLLKVVAKCYHENVSSHKMLASCMRSVREDETFEYFEKLV